MANFTFLNGSATIGATEYSVAQNANYAIGSPKTTLGYVQAILDFSAMTAADQYQIRAYERTNGATQRALWTSVIEGVQSELFATPVMLLGDGWDITVKKLSGTDRLIQFSVRIDTNDVGLAPLQADLDDIQARLPSALVGGRMVVDVGSWAGTVVAVPTVAGIPKVEDATLQARLTSGRATAIDNLDALITSRAATADVASVKTDTTTLLDRLTGTRAGLLDNLTLLDAAVSITAGAATSAANAIANVQSRLPTTLDGDGHIQAGLSAGVISSLVTAIFDFAIEAAPAGATTFVQRLRVWWAILASKASGLAIQSSGTEHFRDAADTKDRAVYTIATDGTRTPGSFDGT